MMRGAAERIAGEWQEVKMRKVFFRLRAAFLVKVGVVFITSISIGSVDAFVSYSMPPIQCPHDPSGYFYAKAKMPPTFEDFSHIAFRYKRSYDDADHRLYTNRGSVYKFAAVKWVDSSFEFTTAAVKGVRYSFTGRCYYVCIFEEFHADRKPGDIAAEGNLIKFVDDKKVAETQVQFVYAPKPRTSKNDVNTPYPSGRTDLFYAVQKGDIARVRNLLGRGVNLNVRDKRGQTALAFGIDSLPDRARMLEIATILIAAGADVNLKDMTETTPLMLAVYEFEDKRGELVNLLLKAGADPNAKDDYDTTALMHAVHGATQVEELITNVKQMIRAGAQVNARNKLGQTALSIAIEAQKDDLIMLLKEAGAKP